MQKAPGACRGACGWAGFWGGPPKTPREGTLVHWYPPGGGGGPKKRHLVLYKLAGFCTADTRPRRTFFSLHSSRLTFEKKSKMCKKCTFWPPKPPKMAILALFRAFFAPFSPRNWGGRGTPFLDPPRGEGGAATRGRGRGRSPPRGFRRKRRGV